MANCYLCGAPVKNGEGYRRNVLTSQSVRVYFSRRGGGSYGQSYGLRTLCHACAAATDKKNGNLNWQIPLSAFMGLVGLVIAVRSRDSVDGALSSLIFAFFLFGGLGFITFFVIRALSSGGDTAPNKVTRQESSQEPENSYGQNIDVASPSYEKNVQIKIIQDIGKSVEAIGISFFGCYGVEVSQKNIPKLIGLITSQMPMSNCSSPNEWSDCLLKNTCNIFINEVGQSTADGVVNIDRLLNVFPGIPDEGTDAYIQRLTRATEKAFEISNRKS